MARRKLEFAKSKLSKKSSELLPGHSREQSGVQCDCSREQDVSGAVGELVARVGGPSLGIGVERSKRGEAGKERKQLESESRKERTSILSEKERHEMIAREKGSMAGWQGRAEGVRSLAVAGVWND